MTELLFPTNQKASHISGIINIPVLIQQANFCRLQYLLVRGVLEDGVGLNFLDFFTAMGMVSLSEA
jgi:hypothetical protein